MLRKVKWMRLRMRLLWILLFSGNLILMLQSCGKVNPSIKGESESKLEASDDFFSQPCNCGDLECWKDTSSKQAVKQRECVETIVATVVPIAGAAIFITQDILSSGYITEFLKDVTKLKAAAASIRENTGKYSPCTTGILDAANGLVAPAGNLQRGLEDFNKSGDEASLASLTSIQVGVFSKSLAGLITTISACKVTSTDAKFLEAKKLVEQNGKKLFKAFINPVENLTRDLFSKLLVVNTVANCTMTNLRGSIVLYSNSKCLVKDFAELKEGRKRVSKALAAAPNRLSASALYFGCKKAVVSYTLSSGDADKNRCINECQFEAATRFNDEFNRKKEWAYQCSASCTSAYTQGFVFNYLDESICNDVLQLPQTKILYRKLQLTDANDKSFESFQAEKQKVSDYLQVLIEHFDELDSANDGVIDGIVTMADFEALVNKPGADPKVLEAAKYIGFSSNSYYFKLIDGASVDGSQDGIISKPDLVYFLEELRDYKHDSEYAPKN